MQSSDAGVGDESAVVSQVAWDVAGQTPMNKRDDLVVDALEASAASEAPMRCSHIVVSQCDCRRRIHSSEMPGITCRINLSGIFYGFRFRVNEYCSPAWSGFCSAADRARLNAVLRRCRRLGYLDDTDTVCVDELFQSADDKLFPKILHNSSHVLQPLIPDRPPSSYDLRPRTLDKLLLDKTTYLNDREFVIHMLYRDIY